MDQKHYDLAELNMASDAEQGYELRLVHPKTDEVLDLTITVLGSDSDAYQDTLRELQRKRAREATKGRRIKLLLSPDEQYADATELLVAATTGWANMTVDGKPLEFSPANARTVYTDRRWRWIREQVDAAINDRANFLPKAASS